MKRGLLSISYRLEQFNIPPNESFALIVIANEVKQSMSTMNMNLQNIALPMLKEYFEIIIFCQA
jgi:hypothetical protein